MSKSAAAFTPRPNDLDAYWMPFTANRAFKQSPRMVTRAKDMHYFSPDGRAILDGTAGLWCANAGHSRAPIVAAIQSQAAELDFAPPFHFGHPKVFAAALTWWPWWFAGTLVAYGVVRWMKTERREA